MGLMARVGVVTLLSWALVFPCNLVMAAEEDQPKDFKYYQIWASQDGDAHRRVQDDGLQPHAVCVAAVVCAIRFRWRAQKVCAHGVVSEFHTGASQPSCSAICGHSCRIVVCAHPFLIMGESFTIKSSQYRNIC